MEKCEVVVSGDNPPDIMKIISVAVADGASVEHLEKLMGLQERWEANEARKAFVVDMAAFKANPPAIKKNRHVRFGNTEFFHSTLANILEKITPALSKYGFSVSWSMDQSKEIKVTCTITHKFGHSESTSMEAPADKSGAKNNIQSIASTVSYLERYTVLALTGLSTIDMDDDAESSENSHIDDKQLLEITNLIKKYSVDESSFLTYLKAEKLSMILSKNYKKAISGLNAKAKK
ncbi:hypothetical protein MNBD_GAMMA01-1306 [hydrothermal vent metagenome]|uniref:Phage related protein n=1 Tax=hydrothermal vent metagenome TaxID=652676 RepID=A0A3B0VPU8_9ZZZZ